MRGSRCANAVRGGDPGCRAARLEHARDERNGISGGTEPARNGRTAQDHLLHHGKRTWSYQGSGRGWRRRIRSEEYTSELQSLMRISYAVFCLKKKKKHSHTQVQKYTTRAAL